MITAIEPVRRDPNLQRVKVGRRTVATLRACDVEAMRITVGKTWTASLENRVQKAALADRARKLAMRLLSRRGYARSELEQKLVSRGHDSGIAARIVQEAVKDGWLNERAFADDIVRGTTRSKPTGRRLIEARLAARGVAHSTAVEALAAIRNQGDESTAAVALARQRLATMRGMKPAVAARRIASLLSRRGFDDETVQAALEALDLQLIASHDDSL